MAILTGVGGGGVGVIRYGLNALTRIETSAATKMTPAIQADLVTKITPKVGHILSDRLTSVVISQGGRLWFSADRGQACEDKVAELSDEFASNDTAHAVLSGQILALQTQQASLCATLTKVDDKVNSSAKVLAGVAGRLEVLIGMQKP